MFGHFGHVTEVFVTGIAEMGCSEAKEDGHRAAIATLVLEIIGAVSRAHLRPGHVAATPANQFGRIKRFAAGSSCYPFAAETHVHLATSLSAVIGLNGGKQVSLFLCSAGRFRLTLLHLKQT